MANLIYSATVIDWVLKQVYKVLLLLDTVVYTLVSKIYIIFMKLAQSQIFSSETFEVFYTRIYAILGVAMLFFVAFQLISAIVNPDGLDKGDKSVGKIAVNTLISLIMLTFISTAFKYLYIIQSSVLTSNVIGNIVVGGSGVESTTFDQAGSNMAASVHSAFFFPNFDIAANCTDDPSNFVTDNAFSIEQCADEYSATAANKMYCCGYYAASGGGNFFGYADESLGLIEHINKNNDEDKITYLFLISTAAGLFVGYVLISFCIDISVRVAKMGFYQLIAPVPILMRIIPSKKPQFDKYISNVISTYCDLFLRLGIIFFAIFIIEQIPNTVATIFASADYESNFLLGILMTAFLIIGILYFAKEAPKLLSDVLGSKGGNLALGIGKKLTSTPLVGKGIGKAQGAISGALGAGLTGLRQNGLKGMVRGMKTGVAEGFDKGGSQFKNQRNSELQRITGNRNAQAGAFGGQKWRRASRELKRKQEYKDIQAYNADAANREEANYRTQYSGKFEQMDNQINGLKESIKARQTQQASAWAARESEVRSSMEKIGRAAGSPQYDKAMEDARNSFNQENQEVINAIRSESAQLEQVEQSRSNLEQDLEAKIAQSRNKPSRLARDEINKDAISKSRKEKELQDIIRAVGMGDTAKPATPPPSAPKSDKK